jgi:DNA helicase-2/ATP-dependent DNA helicase PcrA
MLHGQTRYNAKSRFYEELPEAALKWLTPKNQGFAPSAFGYGGGYATTRGAGGGGSGGFGTGGFGKEAFASPPVPPQKAAPSHGLRVGMQVFHNKFGEGAVLALEGAGDDARAQINFPRHGVKWLALSVAKLTPV